MRLKELMRQALYILLTVAAILALYMGLMHLAENLG